MDDSVFWQLLFFVMACIALVFMWHARPSIERRRADRRKADNVIGGLKMKLQKRGKNES